ncbi:auxin-responsive protein IAA29-like isoform X2 [Cucurbita pepo subsp. pepo]|uniref:auxin-responsive protein IAA29-like isoform X2 n=1 Tax=Cucurbita pepo subsp. pepo TaxID=3664 RepID=UPI000C9D4CB0|nr:auxin-responsive protein IAA29-like isoform X2 [Cucurbita pepo subsp. pepo]
MRASTSTRPIQSLRCLQWPLVAEDTSFLAMVLKVTWTSIGLARLVLDNFLPCWPTLFAWSQLRGEILMELQLELALSVPDRTRGFDLNRNACDRDVFGSDPRSCVCEQSTSHGRHKRGFDDAFFKSKDSSKDLSLLLWSDRSNKEDDDRKDTNHRSSCGIHINVGEENKVVGWPPIKSWRKKHLHQLQQDRLGSDQTNNRYWMEDDEDDGIVFNPKYVKVKMEGVAIARKIDVGLYSSYQTLKTALINMFSNSCYQKCGYSNDSFTLTYQDKEGDWMLAEDLPWQAFLESVHCMKIIRRQSSN